LSFSTLSFDQSSPSPALFVPLGLAQRVALAVFFERIKSALAELELLLEVLLSGRVDRLLSHRADLAMRVCHALRGRAGRVVVLRLGLNVAERPVIRCEPNGLLRAVKVAVSG